MDEKTATHLLVEHGVKPTANRIVIVKALAKERNPSSMKELEDHILSIDKSNIFRALTLFREHHLVHCIEDGDGGMRYELCLSHDHDADEDEHVHFFCEVCHKTFCLHEVEMPELDVPREYLVRGVNVLVKGVCPNCSQK